MVCAGSWVRDGVVFDECEACLYCSLSPLASPCRSVSRSLSLRNPPSGVTVTDPSGTAYPGIPEQLFGSPASVPLRPGDERGSGETSFSFSPSFRHNRKLLFPSYALFFCSSNGEHSGIPRLLFGLWQATLTPIDSQAYVLNKKTEEIFSLPALSFLNKGYAFASKCESYLSLLCYIQSIFKIKKVGKKAFSKFILVNTNVGHMIFQSYDSPFISPLPS